MARAPSFAAIVRHPPPCFVSRQVVTGAGRVGLGQDGRGEGFQLSQRADFFEVEVGLETTLKRPIITTRDEPHADPETYRRLHVTITDTPLSEHTTYLKAATPPLARGITACARRAAHVRAPPGLPRRRHARRHRSPAGHGCRARLLSEVRQASQHRL